MLLLTNDFTGFLVVQLFLPEKEPEEREGEQQDKADPNEHMCCESRKVHTLEIGNGGHSVMVFPQAQPPRHLHYQSSCVTV